MNLRWLWRWMRRTSDKHFPRDVLLITVRNEYGVKLHHTNSAEMLLAVKMHGAQSCFVGGKATIEFDVVRLNEEL